MSFKPPGQCPACGEWVPRKAHACDCCGACEKSGWKADAEVYDGLDLPDEAEDFDYDEFIEREFGGHASGTGKRQPSPEERRLVFWRWVGGLLLAVMILSYLLAVMR